MRNDNNYKYTVKSPDFLISAIFVLIELVLYLVFMWIDLTTFNDSTILKYIGIWLCLLFTVYRLRQNKTDGIFLFLALLFTVASDTLTLVINDYFVLGVSLFIPAQLLYGLRMRIWSQKAGYKSIIARILIIILAVTALIASGAGEPLTIVTVIYFSTLIYNAVESIFFAKNANRLLFCIGLWLFICCDVCVGLFNIGDVLGVNLSVGLEYAVSILMWGFYLPSQVLIVLSTEKTET